MSKLASKSKGGPSTSHSMKTAEDDEDDDDKDDDNEDYDDVDDVCDSNNDSQQMKQTVNSRVHQLEAQCAKLTSENKRLKSDLKNARTKTGRLTKVGMMTHNDWTSQDADLSERISSFCGSYLFRRYKFLNEGWETFNKEDADSLSSFLKRKITAINIGDDRYGDDRYEDQWDRVYVPTICSKFKSLRCNLNNAIRDQYKGKLWVSEC